MNLDQIKSIADTIIVRAVAICTLLLTAYLYLNKIEIPKELAATAAAATAWVFKREQ